jgi:hypothetical protein
MKQKLSDLSREEATAAASRLIAKARENRGQKSKTAGRQAKNLILRHGLTIDDAGGVLDDGAMRRKTIHRLRKMLDIAEAGARDVLDGKDQSSEMGPFWQAAIQGLRIKLIAVNGTKSHFIRSENNGEATDQIRRPQAQPSRNQGPRDQVSRR